MSKQLQNNQAR